MTKKSKSKAESEAIRQVTNEATEMVAEFVDKLSDYQEDKGMSQMNIWIVGFIASTATAKMLINRLEVSGKITENHRINMNKHAEDLAKILIQHCDEIMERIPDETKH